MSLRAANLNLLPVLRALLAEASITRAAAALGLSQPATSHALARLRDLLGDPLLVQVGRTMQLTPRAIQLRARVDSVCVDIEALLLDLDFAPAALQRRFTIATPDYMALLLGPPLYHALRQSAPGASLSFTDVGPDFRGLLLSGAIDIAIVAIVEGTTGGLRIQGGYRDELVGVAADDHPLALASRIEAADLARFPRFGIDPGQRRPMGDDGDVMMMTAADGPLKLSASHLLALPLMVAETDCIAILPRALVDRVARMVPIAAFALPEPGAAFDIGILWSPVHDADPAHHWFRDVVDAAMRAHFPPAKARSNTDQRSV